MGNTSSSLSHNHDQMVAQIIANCTVTYRYRADPSIPLETGDALSAYPQSAGQRTRICPGSRTEEPTSALFHFVLARDRRRPAEVGFTAAIVYFKLAQPKVATTFLAMSAETASEAVQALFVASAEAVQEVLEEMALVPEQEGGEWDVQAGPQEEGERAGDRLLIGQSGEDTAKEEEEWGFPGSSGDYCR